MFVAVSVKPIKQVGTDVTVMPLLKEATIAEGLILL